MHNEIRRLRRAKGWTIKDLAARVGTSEATISRLETHQIAMSVDWLNRFADAFGVKPADLMRESAAADSVDFFGVLSGDGVLAERAPPPFFFEIKAKDRFAIALDDPAPPFQEGDILVCRRLNLNDMGAAGRTTPYALADLGARRGVAAGRLLHIEAGEDAWIFAPTRTDLDATPASACLWIAAVEMRVTQYDVARAPNQDQEGDRGDAPNLEEAYANANQTVRLRNG
ncbi:MAG: helix-turn-helix transcriptional regulator [Pseudomonadota bacterium]